MGFVGRRVRNVVFFRGVVWSLCVEGFIRWFLRDVFWGLFVVNMKVCSKCVFMLYR